ncbi:hypothetical protein TPHA_0C04970 [Tetrapisispora phaffii CBS 4417]|uniref:Transcription initiation factor TFIID subunit 13 n=1 Tax=Tetrapisispora phaffii (strain ATCC 24235 / CBS 4417 / NBRC 1672 / NRRL Y-8282 / UCD 70-5) TaxID=1071381 RepID=G8BQY3_TETPH|nr:hypothetical protein TPHA_0C04970 [Tetrapisispora phaffii CBS 4417]CCE62645.1 hypothetical protein TPHA_0C04970 [Tetrapisispora phaffii CBS 4417]
MSRKLKKTHLFSKDVSSLLYSYGDVAQPLSETANCLDEIISSYLVDVCENAYHISKKQVHPFSANKNKIKLENFRFVLRKDPIKLGRADELLVTNKLITEAKKQFNETDMNIVQRNKNLEGHEITRNEDSHSELNGNGERVHNNEDLLDKGTENDLDDGVKDEEVDEEVDEEEADED